MNKMGIMGRIPFHPVFNQDKINWKPIAWKERQNMSIKVEFSLSVIFCRINNTVLHRKISWTNGLFPMLWVEKLGITLHNSGHSIKATLNALQLWYSSVLACCLSADSAPELWMDIGHDLSHWPVSRAVTWEQLGMIGTRPQHLLQHCNLTCSRATVRCCVTLWPRQGHPSSF